MPKDTFHIPLTDEKKYLEKKAQMAEKKVEKAIDKGFTNYQKEFHTALLEQKFFCKESFFNAKSGIFLRIYSGKLITFVVQYNAFGNTYVYTDFHNLAFTNFSENTVATLKRLDSR